MNRQKIQFGKRKKKKKKKTAATSLVGVRGRQEVNPIHS